MNRVISLVALVFVSIWLTGCVGIGGETISLAHDQLNPPAQQFSDTLIMPNSVDDLRNDQNAIGHATTTLFAIPSGRVKTKTDFNQRITEEVRFALESIGYQVNVVEPGNISTDGLASVKIQVDEFWFRNYNYLWPIVPTWGNIKLRLVVERPPGHIIFKQKFHGKGDSLCLLGECAFKTATREAITDVLNQIIEQLSGEEFHTALNPK